MSTEDDLNPKKRGLGRGLNALFEDEETSFGNDDADHRAEENVSRETGAEDVPRAWKPEEKPARLGLDQLKPGRYQPRREFDDEALEQLAQSIRNHGVLQPLLVQKLQDGTYEIVAGERRWRASQLAQVHDVPVVHVKFDDVQTLEVALSENLQRENLGPLEEAFAFQQLMQEFGQTQDQLAISLGKSRSYIANMVRLLTLPEYVQAALRDGKLSVGHARALITADNAEDLARQVISQGLSVRQTEALASKKSGDDNTKSGSKLPSASPQSAPQKGEKDADIVALEQEVTSMLGMRVSIDGQGQTGRLSIEYKSLDQLDDLLARLSGQGNAQRLM